MHRRKLKVGSFIGILVLGLMVLALLLYTATRTLHFLQMTFPPDMQYVAYLALVAFDGGILGWTLFATTAAEGAPQRAIAYSMIFVCVVGVVVATIADTALVSQANGITKAPLNIATIGMWGSIIVIVLNVVAGICAHLFSPSHMRKFELESVHDEIHQLTIDHIKARARDIMPQLAAENAEHWVRQTMAEVVGTLPHNNAQLSAPRVVESLLSPQLVPAKAAQTKDMLDPERVKPQVDAEKKSLGEKKGFRAWVDKTLFKVEDDGSRGELVSPVSYDQEQSPVEQSQVEEVKQPKLPSDPFKWSHKHWMIAKDNLPWREYKKLFDEYRGDEPEKEYEVIDKPITEERAGHDPRTRRLGGNEEFEDQEDNENPQ